AIQNLVEQQRTMDTQAAAQREAVAELERANRELDRAVTACAATLAGSTGDAEARLKALTGEFDGLAARVNDASSRALDAYVARLAEVNGRAEAETRTLSERIGFLTAELADATARGLAAYGAQLDAADANAG